MASSYEYDAILCLGGIGFGPGSDTATRTAHAANLFHEGLAPTLLLSGAFNAIEPVDQRPNDPLAYLMQAQAVEDHGVPRSATLAEPNSLTTIDNFLRSKAMLANLGSRIVLVTSPQHIKRALATGRHVLGPSYNLNPNPSAGSNEAQQGLREYVGKLVTWTIFRGTFPGDHPGIAARHAKIFPTDPHEAVAPAQVAIRSARLLGGLAVRAA